MRRAAIYCRISDDKTGDELGVTRQLEDCQRLAEQRGWSVVEVLTDNDMSAKGNTRRPGFEAALQLVADDKADILIGWNLDRLTRNRRDTLRLMELGQTHGITIALVRGSDMDLSTPAGRLVAGVLAEVARAEIDTKSDRQIRAYRQAAEAGKPHFVARPYGYTRAGQLIEEEAVVLREAAERFLTGWSLREITRRLNEDRVPAATGGVWSSRVVKEHLLSKRNAGIRVYKGAEYAGQWEPVFPMHLHERLVAEWARRHGSRQRAHGDRRSYLLTGLLYCGRCGAKMAGGAHNDRGGDPVRRKYRCVPGSDNQGCGNLMRVAVTLDHLVTESALYRLDSPALQAQLLQRESRGAEIEPLRQKEGTLELRLTDLLNDYADGTLTKAEYTAARGRVQEQLQEVTCELARLYSSEQTAAMLSPGTNLRSAWEASALGWRRTLLGLVIERIIVHPSHKRTPYPIDDKIYKFDPDAIDIVWSV